MPGLVDDVRMDGLVFPTAGDAGRSTSALARAVIGDALRRSIRSDRAQPEPKPTGATDTSVTSGASWKPA